MSVLLDIAMLLSKTIILVLYFFMGAAVFSFLNVIAGRMPKHEQFIRGKSHCEKCGHELAMKDMVPVVSWVSLKGRCRYCGTKVSFRYMAVELFGGLSTVALILTFGLNIYGLSVFAIFGILVLTAEIDFDFGVIPPVLIAAVLVAGIISLVTMADVPEKTGELLQGIRLEDGSYVFTAKSLMRGIIADGSNDFQMIGLGFSRHLMGFLIAGSVFYMTGLVAAGLINFREVQFIASTGFIVIKGIKSAIIYIIMMMVTEVIFLLIPKMRKRHTAAISAVITVTTMIFAYRIF